MAKAPLPINTNNINNNYDNITIPPPIPVNILNRYQTGINKFWIRYKMSSHGKQYIGRCLRTYHNMVEINSNELPNKDCIFYWTQMEISTKHEDIFVENVYNNDSIIAFVPSQAFLVDKAKFGEIMYQYYGNIAWEFTPLTYNINYMPNKNAWDLKNLMDGGNGFTGYDKDSLWVIKLSAGKFGNNINIFKGNSIEKLNEFLLMKYGPETLVKSNQKHKLGQSNVDYNCHAVIQKYIDKPLLYNGKYKFDLRIYTLVASTNPCLLFYYKGKQRICATEYSNNINFDNDNYMYSHLTNCKIQRKHINYDSQKSTTNGNSMLNDWDTFIEWFYNISVIQKKFNKNWFPHPYRNKSIDSLTIKDIQNIVDIKCKELCKIAYNCVGGIFDNDYVKYQRYGQFCFHGLDIMIDNSGKFYLLEANTAPIIALNGHIKIINATKDLLKEMANILLELRSKRLNNIVITQNTKLKSVKMWQSIKLDYHEHHPFKWNKSIHILTQLITMYSNHL